MLINDIWLTRPMIGDIAATTGCHPRTVERWIRQGKMPDIVYKLLQITENGKLELIHPDWHGWPICARSGTLRTPAGETVHPGDILAIHYRKRLLAHLQTKIRSTKPPEAVAVPKQTRQSVGREVSASTNSGRSNYRQRREL